MIDLYVIQPNDLEGIVIDLSTPATINESIRDVAELCIKHDLLMVSTELLDVYNDIIGYRTLSVNYIDPESGMRIKKDLKNGHIVFVQSGEVNACHEDDLATQFGLTTDHRKANREYD